MHRAETDTASFGGVFLLKTHNLILIMRTTEEKKQIEGVYTDPGGFPGGSDSEVSACNAGDPASIPGSGRSPGEGNGNPLKYSCLENPINEGAW